LESIIQAISGFQKCRKSNLFRWVNPPRFLEETHTGTYYIYIYVQQGASQQSLDENWMWPPNKCGPCLPGLAKILDLEVLRMRKGHGRPGFGRLPRSALVALVKKWGFHHHVYGDLNTK
jgi:hypothetical protein